MTPVQTDKAKPACVRANIPRGDKFADPKPYVSCVRGFKAPIVRRAKPQTNSLSRECFIEDKEQARLF